MAKKKKRNGSRKRRIPILGIGLASHVAMSCGWRNALQEAQAGSFDGAMQQLAIGAQNFTSGNEGLKSAAFLILGRRAFGKVPLITGKKYALTLF